jgi:hypothetical protein
VHNALGLPGVVPESQITARLTTSATATSLARAVPT